MQGGRASLICEGHADDGSDDGDGQKGVRAGKGVAEFLMDKTTGRVTLRLRGFGKEDSDYSKVTTPCTF